MSAVETLSLEVHFPIVSEALEPAFVYVIGRMFARAQCHELGSFHREDAMKRLWQAMWAMQDLIIAIETARHASIALMNTRLELSRMIEAEFGMNPMKHHDWQSWRKQIAR